MVKPEGRRRQEKRKSLESPMGSIVANRSDELKNKYKVNN